MDQLRRIFFKAFDSIKETERRGYFHQFGEMSNSEGSTVTIAIVEDKATGQVHRIEPYLMKFFPYEHRDDFRDEIHEKLNQKLKAHQGSTE